MIDFPSVYDEGQRLQLDPLPAGGVFAHVAAMGAILVVNEDFEAILFNQTGYQPCRERPPARSPACGCCLTWANTVRGLINVTDYEREYAFSERRPPAGDVGCGDECGAAERPPVRRESEAHPESAALAEVGLDMSAIPTCRQ